MCDAAAALRAARVPALQLLIPPQHMAAHAPGMPPLPLQHTHIDDVDVHADMLKLLAFSSKHLVLETCHINIEALLPIDQSTVWKYRDRHP